VERQLAEHRADIERFDEIVIGIDISNHSGFPTVIKLSDYVMEFVADQGVRHVFLVPGGGCMHLVDALGRNKRLEFVANLHEQACAVAADAYGQYTNNLGVALVTTGPGGTNAITGVAGAWLDSTPCLFLSGQVKRADITGSRGVRQMGFQEIDIVRLVQPITKYAVTVTDPQTIRYHLEKAAFLARNGRPGPVWVDIPLDVQALMIDPNSLRPYDGSDAPPLFGIGRQTGSLEQVIRCFNESERPVILAGNGVRLANGLGEFYRLIESLQAPVLLSWKAIDFLGEDHPLYAGRPGAVGQRGANFTQQNADFLLVIGARLDAGQTGYHHRNFARGAKKVVVDIDPNEINKLEMPLEAAFPCDARYFLRLLLQQHGQFVRRDRSAWLKRVKDWQAKYPVVLPEYWRDENHVSNYCLVEVLAQEMASTDLLAPGSSGACSEITMQAFQVKKGMRIYNTEGLGPMGFGVPSALGGCLASGRKRTVCIDGDGGFQMNCQELETIRRLRLPIKFFILNNDGYGSIRTTQRNYFANRFVASDPGSGLTLPDSRKVAEAYGIPTVLIANHGELRTKVRQVLDSDGPMLAEVRIAPGQGTAPKLSSMQKADGSFVSKPMEDLWPFLDRAEFRTNMIVPPLPE
jgi:acetolactate synthase-1/2/3 large subunit